MLNTEFSDLDKIIFLKYVNSCIICKYLDEPVILDYTMHRLLLLSTAAVVSWDILNKAIISLIIMLSRKAVVRMKFIFY